MKLVISEEVQTTTEMVRLLEHISKLVDEGYTNGYYPHWQLETIEEEQDGYWRIVEHTNTSWESITRVPIDWLHFYRNDSVGRHNHNRHPWIRLKLIHYLYTLNL